MECTPAPLRESSSSVHREARIIRMAPGCSAAGIPFLAFHLAWGERTHVSLRRVHGGTEGKKGRYHPAMSTLSPLNISLAAHLACVPAGKCESNVEQTPSGPVAIGRKSPAVQQPPALRPCNSSPEHSPLQHRKRMSSSTPETPSGQLCPLRLRVSALQVNASALGTYASTKRMRTEGERIFHKGRALGRI